MAVSNDLVRHSRLAKETYRMLEIEGVGTTVRRIVVEVGRVAGVCDAALKRLTLNIDVGGGDRDSSKGKGKDTYDELHRDTNTLKWSKLSGRNWFGRDCLVSAEEKLDDIRSGFYIV